MKTRFLIIAGALIAALFSAPTMAQTGPGMGGPGMDQAAGQPMTPGMGRASQGTPRDCAQSRNPEACQAHQQARTQAQVACKDKVGPDRRQCMHDQMKNFDCSKSANPQQCAARKEVYKACKDQTGRAFRQCVQQKMPPADCSQAGNPERCAQHQKARAACQDKFGPEHKACLREQFNLK